VDILVVGVVGIDTELGGGRAQVALGEEVDRGVVVDEDPHTDVELALVHQEGLLYILLQDKRVMLNFILRQLLLLLLLLLLLRLLLRVVKSAASSIDRLCLLLLGLERREHGSRLILLFIRVIIVVIIVPTVLIGTVRLRIK